MQFGTISKSFGLFLKLEYRRWTSHPKMYISVLHLKIKISILRDLIPFLNSTLSLLLQLLFLLLKDKSHFDVLWIAWYISAVYCAVWGTNCFLTEKNSGETVQCMDLFQYAYKLYRAKAFRSAWAPGSGRNLTEDLLPVTLTASLSIVSKNVVSLPIGCTSSKKWKQKNARF